MTFPKGYEPWVRPDNEVSKNHELAHDFSNEAVRYHLRVAQMSYPVGHTIKIKTRPRALFLFGIFHSCATIKILCSGI